MWPASRSPPPSCAGWRSCGWWRSSHAIEGIPPRAHGSRSGRNSCDALLDELEGAPGALPLLSTALLELWRERDGEQLTLAARGARLGRRGRDPGDLYRAARLATALEWSGAHDDELTVLEREFLAAAQERGEREAVAARRTNRRLRALLGGAVALLALAIVAGVVALGQRGQARDAAVGANAERLGATALSEKRLDRSLLLARQGVALDDTVRTRGNLLGAVLRSPAAIGMFRWDHTPVLTEAVSPDGRTLAVGDVSGHVAFFDTATRRHVGTLEPAPNAPGIYGLAYRPDGRRARDPLHQPGRRHGRVPAGLALPRRAGGCPDSGARSGRSRCRSSAPARASSTHPTAGRST